MKVTEAEYLDALCRTSFDAFAQKAFSIVEPAVYFEWSWHIGCIAEHLEAMYRGEITRLIINLPPRSLKSFLVSSAFPAWFMGKKPNAKFINTGYGYEVVEQNAMKCRRIMGDNWYKRAFPATVISTDMDRRTHFNTTQGGQYYAATALSPITGVGCEVMILDDPIKPMEAISDQVRNSVNENIRATLLNRFDDRRIAKLLLVMQRSHVDDPTGNLTKDKGYTIIKLPAETKQKIIIDLGQKHWEMAEGDLLFPQRLGRKDLDQIRLDMTEYHYCTPAETPILMADLSTKRISEIVPGDKVMGFTDGSLSVRRKLTPSVVQNVGCREAPLVKITLDSGKVIRCTAEHRWFNGRSNRSYGENKRKVYVPAKIGNKLCRVCEPEIPVLSSEEDLRMAGWLAGFYDGEGSAVVNKGNKNMGCTISFAQGADRNLPLCHRLEEALNHFGVSFSYSERVREDRRNKDGAPLSRWYWLTGSAIENSRKFLHMIRVNKWRDRIALGSQVSRFVKSEEVVISIEPDTVEPVYSLTTETGNYVAWGLASSNSGQYLQEPVPIGGGEFKDEWLQYYQPGSIKPKTMNIAILVDQAGGEELNKKKKKLSDWTVILVIGLAPDNNYYLLDAIRDRLNPTDRIATIFMVHRKWNELTGKPAKVGCEQIGLMTDTHYLNEKKKQDSYNFPVIPLGAGQRISKEERIRKLIPIMQNGRLYVPPTLKYMDSEGRSWDLVAEFINEMTTFPKSRYDDIIDDLSRILDSELSMVFPKQNIGTVAKARLQATEATDNWEHW